MVLPACFSGISGPGRPLPSGLYRTPCQRLPRGIAPIPSRGSGSMPGRSTCVRCCEVHRTFEIYALFPVTLVRSSGSSYSPGIRRLYLDVPIKGAGRSCVPHLFAAKDQDLHDLRIHSSPPCGVAPLFLPCSSLQSRGPGTLWIRVHRTVEFTGNRFQPHIRDPADPVRWKFQNFHDFSRYSPGVLGGTRKPFHPSEIHPDLRYIPHDDRGSQASTSIVRLGRESLDEMETIRSEAL